MGEPEKDPTGKCFPCCSLGIEYPWPFNTRTACCSLVHRSPLFRVAMFSVPVPPPQGRPSPCYICYLPPPPWFTAPTCFPPVCERNLGTWDMVFPEPWSGEQGGLASLQAPCFLPSPQRLSHIWRAQDTLFCLPPFLVLSYLHYHLVPVVV